MKIKSKHNHLNHFLNQTSKSRGIFLELPELDLFNMNDIQNYEKLINHINHIHTLQILFQFITQFKRTSSFGRICL